MNNKIIELNNSFKNNKTIRMGYTVLKEQENSDELKKIEFGVGTEIEMTKELNNAPKVDVDLDALMEEVLKDNTYSIDEIINIDHLGYTLKIYIRNFKNKDNTGISNYSITAIRSYKVSGEVEVLLDQVYTTDTLYIQGFNEVYGDEYHLDYKSIFNYHVIFKDYSENPLMYNTDGYVSINNGDKYPLECLVERAIIPDKEYKNKNKLIELRSLHQQVESYYTNNVVISVSNYNHHNNQMISLNNDNYVIILGIQENKITLKEHDGKDWVNEIDYNSYNSYVKKLEDKKYHISLDLDWIPDLIELQDGYGNHYIIERYRRLKVIK